MGELKVNERLLAQLAELGQATAARFPSLQVNLTQLLQFPGVLEVAELDQAGLQAEPSPFRDVIPCLGCVVGCGTGVAEARALPPTLS